MKLTALEIGMQQLHADACRGVKSQHIATRSQHLMQDKREELVFAFKAKPQVLDERQLLMLELNK